MIRLFKRPKPATISLEEHERVVAEKDHNVLCLRGDLSTLESHCRTQEREIARAKSELAQVKVENHRFRTAREKGNANLRAANERRKARAAGEKGA